jgi:hypothetical protein
VHQTGLPDFLEAQEPKKYQGQTVFCKKKIFKFIY